MFSVIDIGSNTIRMEVFEYKDNQIIPIFDKKKFGKLANYIDINKNMTFEGMNICKETIEEFVKILHNIKIEKLLVFATASLRNINNTSEVIEYVRTKTNILIEVIDGETEAYYDYLGATYKLDYESGLMIDIGGGSTELIFIENGNVFKKFSFQMGSLNTYNRFVNGIFPNATETKKIRDEVTYILDGLKIEKKDIYAACGIGGSIRGLRKLKNELLKIKGDVITKEDLKKISYYKSEPKKWMTDILQIIPERIYTITVGLIILKTIFKYYNCQELIVSDYGVREGYLLNYLKDVNNNEVYSE